MYRQHTGSSYREQLVAGTGNILAAGGGKTLTARVILTASIGYILVVGIENKQDVFLANTCIN